jgi:pimeloyl-ACP methyl ester carboxylesterase
MRKWIIPIFLSLLAGCTSSQSQTVAVNGVTIDFSVTGEGPPLYLLHGGMESRDSFAKQIPEFAKHFTVVALDSREQGRSGSSDEQISYALMSRDVVALSKHLGHDRISIVGLSDGGVTALTTAITTPELIDMLVLLGANYNLEAYSDETREFLINYKWDGNTDPEKFPGIFVEHYLMGHEDLSGFGDLLDEMAIMWTSSPTFSVSDVSSIKAKTLVIVGDHEDMDLDHTLSLYGALPDAQLFVVPDATHYSLKERPGLVNKVIVDFLTKAPPPSH